MPMVICPVLKRWSKEKAAEEVAAGDSRGVSGRERKEKVTEQMTVNS